MENTPVFKNKLPIQVRFNDVDIMGHVSNTVYQNYFDSGKVNYFDQVIPDLDYYNLTVVGASVKIDYLKPIFMRTRIWVETRISAIGNKSMTIEHRLVDEHSGEVLSTCSTVAVCYSIKDQMSVPIPDHWKKNILAYDEGVIVK